MDKIKRFFTDKRFIYGSGSVALVVGFIVVAVLVNIIVGTLSDKFTLKLDLTENKIFQLSDETVSIVKDINVPVDVILFVTTGYDDSRTREIIDRYISLSPNLRLRINDPVKDPMSVQKYNTLSQNISAGSIVFDNGTNFKVVHASEMYGYNPYTQQNDQFQAETKLTSAIISLSKRADMKAAFTQGHGEVTVNQAEQILKDDNIAVEKVTTVNEGFSDEYDMFIIVSPKMDFSADEIESLDMFLKNGKSVQIYLDVETPELPRLESYLYDMGIIAERNIVLERDSQKILHNTPYSFMPTVNEHPITRAIINNNLYVVSYASRVINTLWEERNNVKLEPLLQSSGRSVADTADGTQQEKRGPFNLAVVASRYSDGANQGKILVMGSSLFLNEQLLLTNKDFFIGSVNWQIDDTEAVNIRPKSLSSSTLELTKQDFNIWLTVLVIFIPILVLVLGFATWLRRRHL